MIFNGIINDSKMDLIKRTVKILDLLSASDGKMRFSDLAEKMRLPSPSTLTRLLKAMTEAGVLYKDQQGMYCISAKVSTWSKLAQINLSLKEIVFPELEKINLEHEVSTICFQPQPEAKMYCVIKFSDANSPALQDEGNLIPLNLGVLGSCFCLPERELFSKDFISSFSSHVGIEDLINKFIEDSKNYGWIYDYGKLFPDNHRLAVPIRYEGKTVAVIGAGFMPGRMKQKGFLEKIGAALMNAAENIEKQIYKQNGDC